MRHLRHATTAILLGMLVTDATAGQRPPPPKSSTAPVNADAATLMDFQRRLDRYIQLQRNVAKQSLRLRETSNAAEIAAAEDVLAAKLRALRKDAKPGDIFTPQVRALFRRLMYPELKGEDGPETKASIAGHDAPPPVALRVNAGYPDAAPLPTVPPNLLARLPQLPMDVEYRIVGKDLILRDVDANIIVDFIPRAIR